MLVGDSPFDTDKLLLEARLPYWAQVKYCLLLKVPAVTAACSSNLMHVLDNAVNRIDKVSVDRVPGEALGSTTGKMGDQVGKGKPSD